MESSYTETEGDPGMGQMDSPGLLTVEQVITYSARLAGLVNQRSAYTSLLELDPPPAYAVREAATYDAAIANIAGDLARHDIGVRVGNALVAAQPFPAGASKDDDAGEAAHEAAMEAAQAVEDERIAADPDIPTGY